MEARHPEISGYKVCNICGENRKVNDFHKSSITKTGKRGECKLCQGSRNRQRKYNLSDEEYKRLISIKECQICGARMKKNKHSIDHDHTTGKVRGVLCVACNQKLGWFEKNSDGVLKYLSAAK